MKFKHYASLLLLTVSIYTATAQMNEQLLNDIENIEAQVIDSRHYFHEKPELSNREFNRAKKIAVRAFGYDTHIAILMDVKII